MPPSLDHGSGIPSAMDNEVAFRNPIDGLDYEKSSSPNDEKASYRQADVESTDESASDIGVLHTERDIATTVVTLEDDPTANPWTFRALIIGTGLSVFGGVLGKFLQINIWTTFIYLHLFSSGNILLQAGMFLRNTTNILQLNILT